MAPPNRARRIVFLLIQTLSTFWAERIWILRILIFSIFWTPTFWISRSPDLNISGFPGPQVSKFPDLQIPRFPGSQISRRRRRRRRTNSQIPTWPLSQRTQGSKYRLIRRKGPCCDRESNIWITAILYSYRTAGQASSQGETSLYNESTWAIQDGIVDMHTF